MALSGPGTPRNLRPTARARGLPDGVTRCGSRGLLTWVSVTCGTPVASGGGLSPGPGLGALALGPWPWGPGLGALALVLPACWPCRPAAACVVMIKYDTCARTLYANSVPPRGAAVNGRLACGLRGYGAAGIASAWHAEGPGFDSP